MRDAEREVETQQRERQAPCREPNAGLDPRIQGSHPELKADAQPLSQPGAPVWMLPIGKKTASELSVDLLL